MITVYPRTTVFVSNFLSVSLRSSLQNRSSSNIRSLPPYYRSLGAVGCAVWTHLFILPDLVSAGSQPAICRCERRPPNIRHLCGLIDCQSQSFPSFLTSVEGIKINIICALQPFQLRPQSIYMCYKDMNMTALTLSPSLLSLQLPCHSPEEGKN